MTTNHGLFADGVEAIDVDAELYFGRAICKHMHVVMELPPCSSRALINNNYYDAVFYDSPTRIVVRGLLEMCRPRSGFVLFYCLVSTCGDGGSSAVRQKAIVVSNAGDSTKYGGLAQQSCRRHRKLKLNSKTVQNWIIVRNSLYAPRHQMQLLCRNG